MSLSEHDRTVHKDEVTIFGAVNFRNQMRKFGIKTEDRRRHMYIIGKSGTGKTTLLENMMYQDVMNGHGLALVDPHGDFAENIVGFAPPHREHDVIYINPADIDYPVGFNVLEWKKPEEKYLIGAGLMGVFKKIWPDVWSARMEHIMNNCILALLDYPNSTLLGINRLLIDRDYRRLVVNAIQDPVVKSFWLHEFERWEPKFQKEAVAPIQNKVGQFLASSLIRNIVAQPKSTFDIRAAMDEGKIVVINLSKGRIGEDASRLLGGMLITKIQLAAMERVDTPEDERRDFYLYVDEFQNFATESFANILSEARKYRLNLIVAHQYTLQLDETVAAAVFGNVGTIASFRVGAKDAEFLEPEFTPDFTVEDLVNLPNRQIYLKLMINGVTSKPFSANTLPPIGKADMARAEKIIGVSRSLYAKRREDVERQIVEWSESYGESGPARANPTDFPTKKELLKTAPKITETELVLKGDEESSEPERVSEKPAELSLASLSGVGQRPPKGPSPKPEEKKSEVRLGSVPGEPQKRDVRPPRQEIELAKLAPMGRPGERRGGDRGGQREQKHAPAGRQEPQQKRPPMPLAPREKKAGPDRPAKPQGKPSAPRPAQASGSALQNGPDVFPW